MKKSIFGMLLLMESLFLLVTTGVALYYHRAVGDQDWQSFAIATVAAGLTGSGLLLWGKLQRRVVNSLSRGDSIVIVALTWVVFSVFGCLPFVLTENVRLSVTDAVFETMSGFTTTGATILNHIDDMPHGLLFWRSVMQWMGGLGIVVLSFALIPSGDMKNSNMFQAEMTGISLDRLTPKIGATARRLLSIYVLLTCVCMGFYWAGPMNLFDAANHAMTTLATGGFSTHQASLGFYQSAYVEYVGAAFMLIASINFSLFYFLSIGRSKVFTRNEEMQTFLWVALGAVAMYCLLFRFAPHYHHNPGALLPTEGPDVLRASVFHVSTVISSGGFQGQYFDYVGWGGAYWMPTVLLMAVGGCAGSTAGGIKVVRMLIYVKCVLKEFQLHLHPRAVLAVRVSGQVVSEPRIRRAIVYILMYVMLSIVGILAFTHVGVDVDSAIGCCISSLSNVGPGTGCFGPDSSFAQLPDPGKWLMSFYMLVGRLEIFTVMFLFMPRAWKSNY
ncbi:MAG: TrkH family potassium uptake protein [Bacteroidaceae bacterium]|nr:TrkH family potassium uptake protein [Bacteroidaceae bacterium]